MDRPGTVQFENGLWIDTGRLVMSEIKLPELKILPIGKLYPHEELDSFTLRKIKESMTISTFTNPIIVDKYTNVVLDGMHRFELLKQLDYSLIPCQLVDYLSDDIEVKSWFPTLYIKGDIDKNIKMIMDATVKFCDKNGIIIEMDDDPVYVQKISNDMSRPCLCSIIFPDSSDGRHMILRNREGIHTIVEITEFLKKFMFELETILKKNESGWIRFHADERAKSYLDSGDKALVHKKKYNAIASICRTNIQKKEVLGWALRRKLFPMKSTRHIIKACRALYINIPFSLLKGKISEKTANEKMSKLLSDSKHIHRLYIEPILIYDELMYGLTK